MTEQSNKEMIIELRGEIKLIHQKIDTLTNNHMHHFDLDLARLTKFLVTISTILFSGLITLLYRSFMQMALSNTRGLCAELTALAYLANDPNILCFTAAGGLGPIDIITLNRTTGERRYFDVKYASKRKNHKPTHNPNINRCLTKAQQELPLLVEIIYVDNKGQITIQRDAKSVE